MSNELQVHTSVNWVIHSCVTPGCSVTIRVPYTEQHTHGVCKWCARGIAYNTRDPYATRHVIGANLSRDEFGGDLFDAIKAQSESLQAFKHADLCKAKGLTVDENLATHVGMACQHELETIFTRNTIAAEDVRRILAMH